MKDVLESINTTPWSFHASIASLAVHPESFTKGVTYSQLQGDESCACVCVFHFFFFFRVCVHWQRSTVRLFEVAAGRDKSFESFVLRNYILSFQYIYCLHPTVTIGYSYCYNTHTVHPYCFPLTDITYSDSLPTLIFPCLRVATQ